MKRATGTVCRRQMPAGGGMIAGIALVGLSWCWHGGLAAEPVAQPSTGVPSESPADQSVEHPGPSLLPERPAVISLAPGEVRNVPVEGITRVVIGDPEVVDVTIVSPNDLILQATAKGKTNVIVWDRRGQTAMDVAVVDPIPETLASQLQEMITQLNLQDVQVKREEDKVFLTGQVSRPEDLARLNQMTSAYPNQVKNLVAVAESPAPVAEPPASVKLTVQLVEMTRDGTDKFGVDWVDSLTFTETTFGALGPTNVSQVARLGEAFRLGALTRSGLSAILNMLVSQGKARVLAEPKLVAASGKTATANIGVEVPVVTATSISSGTVTQSIEFKQTGVELEFQPTVFEDGHSIQLLVDAKVSSIDKTQSITVSGIVVPGFRNRQTKTELVVDSGQTVLIAGLLQDEEKKNLSQLPGVGSIPVLGNLFRSTEFVRGQTELIILVTPELAAEAGTTAEKTVALEQSLATAEVSGAMNDPVLRYALQVQERIAQSIHYPSREHAMGMSGRVKLRVRLLRDGTLGNAMISEPSGIEVFDAEALKAVERQAPYPPFPSDLPQQELWLDLPVLFKS